MLPVVSAEMWFVFALIAVAAALMASNRVRFDGAGIAQIYQVEVQLSYAAGY